MHDFFPNLCNTYNEIYIKFLIFPHRTEYIYFKIYESLTVAQIKSNKGRILLYWIARMIIKR